MFGRTVTSLFRRCHLFALERLCIPYLLSAVITSLRSCVERSIRLFIVPFLLLCRPSFFRPTIHANKVFVNIPKWWRIIRTVRDLLGGIGNNRPFWHAFEQRILLLFVLPCHGLIFFRVRLPAIHFQYAHRSNRFVFQARMGRYILCQWPAATGPVPLDPRKPRTGRHRSRAASPTLSRPVNPRVHAIVPARVTCNMSDLAREVATLIVSIVIASPRCANSKAF
jgi:hypothetical protein